ncbi:hypothetical protein ACFPN4_10925 [Ureibacillus thermophilus]|uniref:hypothetical protein n=1 Tax=Ureibacillus thermophilus TaxID=367743 RepID=UPI003614766A
MKDISHWTRIGYGGKSTLAKEELIHPETNERYLIKYPRETKIGVSWEDITEFIAAEIGRLLNLSMMDVEIVTRNGKRGCLLKNFIPKGVMNEEGGVLLRNLSGYDSLLNSKLSSYDLIQYGFDFIKKLKFWEQIKPNFIEMNFFDILIGNQDRHPFNWMVLFKSMDDIEFSTIYDNGASLGFRFDDVMLKEYIENKTKLEKYMRNSKVKAGLFEKKQVKSKEMILYLKKHFFEESEVIIKRIANFDFKEYENIIQQCELLSRIQKQWLITNLYYRSETILKWYYGED